MFKLLAGSRMPGWTGQVAEETFETLNEAEDRMREWARFGVDGYCNDPDTIWVTDAEDHALKYWNWRTKRAEVAVVADESE